MARLFTSLAPQLMENGFGIPCILGWGACNFATFPSSKKGGQIRYWSWGECKSATARPNKSKDYFFGAGEHGIYLPLVRKIIKYYFW